MLTSTPVHPWRVGTGRTLGMIRERCSGTLVAPRIGRPIETLDSGSDTAELSIRIPRLSLHEEDHGNSRCRAAQFHRKISMRPPRVGAATAVIDMTDRLAADRILLQAEEAVQVATIAVAISQDRERIALDLHDTVVRRLFAAGMRLQSAMRLVDDAARILFEQTVDDLDETILEVRNAVFHLQGMSRVPNELRRRLIVAVAEAGEVLGFDPRLHIDGPVETTEVNLAEHLLSVLREALSNIAQHANARNVQVDIVVAVDVVLSVHDDGVGFPDDVFGGQGLASIARRADILGGESSIVSQLSGGTLLTWRVPRRSVVAQNPT